MREFSVQPREMIASLWRNRHLCWSLCRREVVGRYRGSFLGLFWSFFNPLLMLGVYTFAFSVIFQARWHQRSDSRGEFAIILFVGLLVFLLGIPVSLSEGLMGSVMFLGVPFFGFMEFLMDYLLLPGGGLLTAIYAGHVWSARRTRDEANQTTGGIKAGLWFELLLKWVIPASILVIMVLGFWDRLIR